MAVCGMVGVIVLLVVACGGADSAEADTVLPAPTDLVDTGIALDEEAPPPPSAPELATNVRLEVGSEGEQVRALQEILERLGYDPGGIDGIFGPNTRKAVVAFQRDRGLDPVGVVDQETATALNAAVAESEQG